MALAGCADLAPPPVPPPPTDHLAAPGRPGWSVDIVSGCWLWNRAPEPGETVRWTGDCPSGPAIGRGEAVWQIDGPSGPRTITDSGDFRDGRLEGRGKTVASTGAKYEGYWRDGRQDGQGVLIAADGSRYEGQFQAGKPNGAGRIIGRDAIYEGHVRDSKPHGGGRIEYANGTWFAGNWRDGRADGYGEVFVPPDRSLRGVWHDGCMIRRTNTQGSGIAIGVGRPPEECRWVSRPALSSR
jgi:hypothetical protein